MTLTIARYVSLLLVRSAPPSVAARSLMTLLAGLVSAGAACVFTACGSTDLQVIEEVPAEQQLNTTDAGSTPAATDGPVTVSTAPSNLDDACGSPVISQNRYRFHLQADATCLSGGGPTTVNGFDAYDVETTSVCNSASATWQLTESTFNSFELRNQATDYNLDVELGDIDVGSPLVLFAPHGRENQKFSLSQLQDGSVALNPYAHIELCVTASSAGVVIETCVVGNSSQKWYIETDNCPAGQTSQ